jgi:hypothetical protein
MEEGVAYFVALEMIRLVKEGTKIAAKSRCQLVRIGDAEDEDIGGIDLHFERVKLTGWPCWVRSEANGAALTRLYSCLVRCWGRDSQIPVWAV